MEHNNKKCNQANRRIDREVWRELEKDEGLKDEKDAQKDTKPTEEEINEALKAVRL